SGARRCAAPARRAAWTTTWWTRRPRWTSCCRPGWARAWRASRGAADAMSLAFGSPWMLWGAALVALPILIHLLNRRRYVVVPFAAMSFLLAAFKSRRRRLRLENLLLLLLRCLLVLLAALAMALPFVPEDSPLAALSGGPRELVLIVDRSGSMGRLVAPGVTADDRVLESLRRRLGALSEERGDAVTLICMG